VTSTCGRDLAEHLDQVLSRLVEVGAQNARGCLFDSVPHHPGVTVATGAAEETVIGHAEGGARPFELDLPVATELIAFAGGQHRQRGHVISPSSPRVHVTRVTWVSPLAAYVRHRRATTDRLVVRCA
jgi:hypothetical protein